MQVVLPEGWARPSGYSNALVTQGRIITLAGQVGWNPQTCTFETDDFVGQLRQALLNITELLHAAGARREDIVRLTWYIIDRNDYASNQHAIGETYRAVMGKHFPAMTLVIVAGLLEPSAKLEIEATAVIP